MPKEPGEPRGEFDEKEHLDDLTEEDLAKKIEDGIVEISKVSWEIFHAKEKLNTLYLEREENP